MGVVDRWKQKLSDRKAKEAAALKAYESVKKQRKAAERVIARHDQTPPRAALQYAQAHVGVTESPPGSNRGKEIDVWERACGTIAQPWCGCFMKACLEYTGVKGLTARMAYCPYIIEDAKAGKNGLLKVVPLADRKAGDLLVYQWDTGAVDHVGMYVGDAPGGQLRTIEGNTSKDAAGSQSNGGIVANKVRDPKFVAAVVRPRYPA